MSARQKCKILKKKLQIANDSLHEIAPILARHKLEHEKLKQQIAYLQWDIDWYQVLYDKARAAQKHHAEDAERLRRENAQLRADLERCKPFWRRWLRKR